MPKHSVRCFSIAEGFQWADPVTVSWHEGELSAMAALISLREHALQMRDMLAERFEEPFEVQEYAMLPIAEVVCVRTGQPKVRYERIDEERIENYRARMWMCR